MKKFTFSHSLFVLIALLCLTPWVSSAVALVLGFVLALTIRNPFTAQTKKLTNPLLRISVVGLGAGMNLMVVGNVGYSGISYTFVGIAGTLLLGSLLGRLLNVSPNTSILVSVGTAICGGSAIAAIAPVIDAKDEEISVALSTVFLLNATALFLFPPLGRMLALNENQFGLWSALAIHDTSSVVGAALQYGSIALVVATTVKLTRALWIVPVTFLIGAVVKSPDGKKVTVKIPWFILGFLVMAAIATWIPVVQPIADRIVMIAKRTLVLTLFLIGSGLTKSTLQNVGFKPFLQGIMLWFFVATFTLVAILAGWVSY